MRQGTIADTLGIEGPSLVRLLDQLCTSGLVCHQEDRADRRAKTVHLTRSGSDLAVRIEAVLAELRPMLLDGVSAADLNACLRVSRTVGGTIGWTCPIPARPAELAQ